MELRSPTGVCPLCSMVPWEVMVLAICSLGPALQRSCSVICKFLHQRMAAHRERHSYLFWMLRCVFLLALPGGCLKVPLFHPLLPVCFLSFCVWGQMSRAQPEKDRSLAPAGTNSLWKTLMGACEEYHVDAATDVGLRGQAGCSDAYTVTGFTFQPSWRGHKTIHLASLGFPCTHQNLLSLRC